MGNSNSSASVGDLFTCFRRHQNMDAVHSSNMKFGVGHDLDDAVLAATNKSIDRENHGLVN